jgi:hypothetical protein
LLRIRIAKFEFTGCLEIEAAPISCFAFQELLPCHMKMIHCRWSGEAGWVPLGKWEHPWLPENQTSRPSPGQVLLYAAGPSEPELLIPYGCCSFNSKTGELKGNHFLTIIDNHEQLSELGRLLIWKGAQNCIIERLRQA